MGSRNRVLHFDSWQRSYNVAAKLASFCGHIAAWQLSENRHFLIEQPFPSRLYEVQPWPSIRSDPRCKRVVFDQCQVGQTLCGKPVKKPTELVASHELLLHRFANHICKNQHEHFQLLGGQARHAQVWPRKMCEMLAASIYDLICHESQNRSYPTVSTATEENPTGEEQPHWRKCKGCLWRLHKHSPQHTRVAGECKHSEVETIEFDCPACRTDKHRSHPLHTLGPGCRHAVTSSRSSSAKPRSVRETTAPRPARVPTHVDPTASLRSGEEQTLELEAAPTLRGHRSQNGAPEEASASDGPIVRAGPRDVEAHERASHERQLQPRSVEEETQTPELSDWTKFDLQASLRELHVGTPAQKRRLVRKLHLRWWHCGATTLHRLLKAAGAPTDVLDMVAEIVDTCRICRAWSRPTNSMASSRLVTSFNEEVEGDIVFVKFQGNSKSFLHLVDRATRWCATCEIADRATSTLLNAIDATWVAIFGPMKVLLVDGEPGLDNEESTWYFQVRGIEKRTAAVQQHIRIADRRVQILRSSIHKIGSQLSADGVAMPFCRVLSESTFVINSISSIGGVSPYVAVLGRAPALMPELGPADPINDDRNAPDPVRNAMQIRQLAIQTITESTARERLRIASHTPTRPSAEELEYRVGDSVEYFREPSNRDISGWRGPATVVDLTRVEHGRIGIRTSTDQVLNCRVQDIRHRLAYLTELDPNTNIEAPLTSHAGKAQQYIQQNIETLTHGTVLCLGQMPAAGGRWVESSRNRKYRMTLHAAIYLAEVVFQLQDVAAIRVAIGVKNLSPQPEYSRSLTVWWLSPEDRNIRFLESEDTRLVVPSLAGPDWAKVRLVQFLCVSQSAACVPKNWQIQDDRPVVQEREEQEQSNHDRLSTIPEGTEEDGGASQTTARESSQSEVQQTLHVSNQATHQLSEDELSKILELENILGSQWIAQTDLENMGPPSLPTWSEVKSVGEDQGAIQLLAEVLGEHSFEMQHSITDDRLIDADETGIFVAIEVQGPQSIFLEGIEQELASGEVVELRCYESHVRKAVIDRSDDVLTSQEIKENAESCYQAMLRELKTWHDLKCFARRRRSEATCVIDTRWVFKWKIIDGVRSIRARLTLRGFKESGAEGQSNYSATATKWSQRVLVSEAVLRKWNLASTDISKAFLQGITYAELAEETQQPLRDVSFEVCPRTALVLSQIPGYADFQPSSEVLHCLKPGTGCRDAPRAWALKLRKATKEFGLQSSLIDSELEYLWVGGNLKLIVLKHVDDIKMAGEAETISQFVAHLSKTFGKLELHWNDFKFCGIQHTQNPQTFEVKLDQTHFISVIKPMHQSEIAGKPGQEKMPESLRRHFLSLLMTIAYAVQSRPDIAVYIAALQKESQEATFESARRLNKVLMWAQKHPVQVHYKALSKYPDCLVLVSDSAFKAREQDGLSMRGMVALRMHSGDLNGAGDAPCHMVHTVSKTQRHVTRSTFASELFAATDAVDFGLTQVLSLIELISGPMTWENAYRLQENAGATLPVSLILILDAKAVTSALIAPTLRAPAENSALVSVAWLREQMRCGKLSKVFWSDTRVMVADGLTKGAISREEIQSLMRGSWKLHVPLQLQIPQTWIASHSPKHQPTWSVLDIAYQRTSLPTSAAVPEASRIFCIWRRKRERHLWSVRTLVFRALQWMYNDNEYD